MYFDLRFVGPRDTCVFSDKPWHDIMETIEKRHRAFLVRIDNIIATIQIYARMDYRELKKRIVAEERVDIMMRGLVIISIDGYDYCIVSEGTDDGPPKVAYCRDERWLKEHFSTPQVSSP